MLELIGDGRVAHAAPELFITMRRALRNLRDSLVGTEWQNKHPEH